jgi:hypothetical protein
VWGFTGIHSTFQCFHHQLSDLICLRLYFPLDILPELDICGLIGFIIFDWSTSRASGCTRRRAWASRCRRYRRHVVDCESNLDEYKPMGMDVTESSKQAGHEGDRNGGEQVLPTDKYSHQSRSNDDILGLKYQENIQN